MRREHRVGAPGGASRGAEHHEGPGSRSDPVSPTDRTHGPLSPVSASDYALVVLALALACADDPADPANDAGDDASTSAVSAGSSDTGADDTASDDGASDDGASDDAPSEFDGAVAFANRCASCHGPDAAGTMLAPQNRNPDAGYAEWIVRNGRDDLPFDSAMPMFGAELADDELDAILAHLRSFPKPADGEGLFVMFCANCHGPDAQGGRVEKDITREVEDGVGKWREQVREGEGGTSYALRTGFMPSWGEAELTDAEVAAVHEYVGTLPLGPDVED